MAKISAKKSNLKTIANKIIVSPNTDAVADVSADVGDDSADTDAAE